jgi:WD40 repeat protein
MILSRQDDAIDLDWSPDNTQIAFVSMHGGVGLWNIVNGQINALQVPATETQWKPDGTQLAIADNQDGTIRITNTTTWQSAFTLLGHIGGVVDVEWSPDGAKIASAGVDNKVRIWNAATGSSLFELSGHTAVVSAVAWNQNNRVLASSSGDGTVRLWDTQSGQPLGIFEVGGQIRAISWNPSGNRLIYGGDAGTFTIMDYPSSTGRGLRGAYYALNNLTGIRFFRLSNQINFNWAASSPEPNIRSQVAVIPVDNFSVRWTGFIEPLYTEAYTFFVNRNDGARLWVNGQQIINAWTNTTNAVETSSTAITLTAGVRVPITLEYYEATGNAQVSLSWQSARQTKQIVPSSALYPPEDSGSIPEVSP